MNMIYVVYLLSLVCLTCAKFDISCFNLNSRGDPTFINMQLPDIGFGLRNEQTARHHILRFDRIRLFFNTALHYNNDVRRELIEISLKLLENSRIFFGTSDRLAFRIAWENLDTNFDMGDSTTIADLSEWLTEQEEDYAIRTLHALWTWMPFNYVIGPLHRSDDDTSSNLDCPMRRIIGSDIYGLFEGLNSEMNRFFHEPPSSSGVVCTFRSGIT